jgi:hypothetical protein
MLNRAASTARRRWQLLLAGLLVLTSVLFAGLWLGAANAGSSRANTFSGVPVNEFDAADSRLERANPLCATESWTDVPGATVAFTVEGTTSAPVLADVSVQARSNNEIKGLIRLLIDGAQEGAGSVRWTPTANHRLQPLSYTFLTLPLAPGPHTATIQYMVENLLTTAPYPPVFCIPHWTLAILHT